MHCTGAAESPYPAVIRHIILDRDGVLNKEAPDGGWMHHAENWQWEENALEGLRKLAATGVRLSVATNQSGIGRGIFSSEDVDGVHDRMRAEAEAVGARFASIHVCPHAPETECVCRKPAPGLIAQAIEHSEVPRSETILVGDAARDLEAGAAAGIKTVLVRTGKGAATEAVFDNACHVPVFDDLLGLAEAIVPFTERP